MLHLSLRAPRAGPYIFWFINSIIIICSRCILYVSYVDPTDKTFQHPGRDGRNSASWNHPRSGRVPCPKEVALRSHLGCCRDHTWTTWCPLRHPV